MSLIEKLVEKRAYHPEAIARALQNRPPANAPSPGQKILVLACDHPARGALGASGDPMAMASREELLTRCMRVLACEGVDGFLGTADVVEDLALLHALDHKMVWGSMNRGGIEGTDFEMDDRFTGYDPRGLDESGLNGGKMLLRVGYDDVASANTLESCGKVINVLAGRGLNAMIEPFIARRENGRFVNDLSPEAVIRSINIASGLGATSSATWLKLPCVDQMERVMESTTLPSLILGGDPGADREEAFARWEAALKLPNVIGMVIGRSLLFPPDGDIEGTVQRLVNMF